MIKDLWGEYGISDTGKVFSYKNNKKREMKARGPYKKGLYLTVVLRKNGISVSYYIHRLVAEHFVKRQNSHKNQVNHNIKTK